MVRSADAGWGPISRFATGKPELPAITGRHPLYHRAVRRDGSATSAVCALHGQLRWVVADLHRFLVSTRSQSIARTFFHQIWRRRETVNAILGWLSYPYDVDVAIIREPQLVSPVPPTWGSISRRVVEFSRNGLI